MSQQFKELMERIDGFIESELKEEHGRETLRERLRAFIDTLEKDYPPNLIDMAFELALARKSLEAYIKVLTRTIEITLDNQRIRKEGDSG